MPLRKIELNIPKWVTPIFIILSLVLLPWTIYLGATLPVHHLSAHWDISWTGLDLAIFIAMLFTGIFAYLKSRLTVVSSSTVGSLLLVDAWFDVMSQRMGLQLHEAIFLAIFVEIPLSILSYYIAIKALHSN